MQYAVEVLRVKHIIVCGHYGCGGIEASLGHDEYGVVDNWLRHIKDIVFTHKQELDGLSEKERCDRLCELNVMTQVQNVCHTTIVQKAWHLKQNLSISGWIYQLDNGQLKDLGCTVDNPSQIDDAYRISYF